MTPEDKGNGHDEEHRDDTEEWDGVDAEGDTEIYDGHEDLEHDEDEEAPKEVGAPAAAAADDDLPDDDGGGEDAPSDDGEDAPSDEGESELEELISAETQEWDGLEAAEGADEEPPEEEEHHDEEPEADAEEPEEEQTLVGTAGARLGAAGSAVTTRFQDIDWRPGFPMWLRFITASFAIVASIAVATAASLILYLGDIADALEDETGQIAGADKFLTQVDGGGPQTIMILGSDKRPEDKGSNFRGLSDTTMLLRLDPDQDAIALFSLPRDLQVEIPGRGTAKLNEAYAYGGPQLTLQTVEELLSFPGREFEVNHLVNVDFEGFARAVNEIDCVYVDVDRRYFHSNDSTSALADYEEIDIQPGYQAL